MTDDRIVVLANVRAALAKRRDERAPLPDWDDALVVSQPAREFGSLAEQFQYKLEAAGGVFLDGWAALSAFLAARGVQRGYVDPGLLDFVSPWPPQVSTHFDREKVDDYDFSVTRAVMGIAESGSIVLNEARSSSRLGALSSWLHVAVLDRAHLVGTIPEAIAGLGEDRAIVFVTGPSKTADVEGILITGVHGPGVQACCLV